ncbi:hypothetical protein JCM6882_000585 [Rhodosporidiobolus microsporus]
MPLWMHRPATWPSTVEEALAVADEYGISREFIQNFGSRIPPEKKAAWIQSYAAFAWNSRAVPAWFNWVLYKFLIALVLAGLAQRLVASNAVSRLPRPFRRLHTLGVKYISLAPFFGRSNLYAVPLLPAKSRLANWTTVQIPLRVDFLVVCLFLAGNIAVVFTGYEPLVPSIFYPDDPTPFRQNARYFADRAGILALGSTPLVILLAARNSPLNWLAGLNFGTMQFYHRWVARVTFVNVGLHAVAYSWLILQRDGRGVLSLFDKWYIVFGWLAFLGGIILCFAAWRRLRQIAYEFFLVGHIIAALFWLVGAYLHVFLLLGHSGDMYYVHLCYIAAGAWAFDRVLRLSSLIWNNTVLGRLFTFSSSPSKTRFLAAQGALVGASDDFLRLRITPKAPWSRRRGGPGAYVFISSLTTFAHKAWESHPFSIAWPLGVPDVDELDCPERVVPTSPPYQEMVLTPGAETPTKLDDLSTVVPAASSPSVEEQQQQPHDPHPFDIAPCSASFELLIKKYSGFTRSLASSLSIPLSDLPSSESDDPLVISPEQLKHLRIAAEGPYGAAPSHAVARYRQALLVAGGSGLAMVTSQLADLGVQFLKRACKEPPENVRTERVAVVWSVRETETIHLITPYLRRLYTLFRSSPSFVLDHLTPPPSQSDVEPFLDLHIYVTGAGASLFDAESTITALSLPPAFLRCTVHGGRPDIGARIDALGEGVRGAKGVAPELLVVSCGPGALCDSAREAVRSRLRGLPSLFRRRRAAVEDKEEEETTEEEAEEGQGLLRRREKTVWKASQLVYSEEAVVW